MNDSILVPLSIVERIADFGIIDDHDDNGPGHIVCTACGERERMRWSAGRRLDTHADLVHSDLCPAEWARAAIARQKLEPTVTFSPSPADAIKAMGL